MDVLDPDRDVAVRDHPAAQRPQPVELPTAVTLRARAYAGEDSVTAVVNVTVNPANDQPVITGQTNVPTIVEKAGLLPRPVMS